MRSAHGPYHTVHQKMEQNNDNSNNRQVSCLYISRTEYTFIVIHMCVFAIERNEYQLLTIRVIHKNIFPLFYIAFSVPVFCAIMSLHKTYTEIHTHTFKWNDKVKIKVFIWNTHSYNKYKIVCALPIYLLLSLLCVYLFLFLFLAFHLYLSTYTYDFVYK